MHLAPTSPTALSGPQIVPPGAKKAEFAPTGPVFGPLSAFERFEERVHVIGREEAGIGGKIDLP